MNSTPLSLKAPRKGSIVIAAVASVLLAGITAAQAQQGGAPVPQFGVPPQIKKQLNITDAQEAKIKTIQQKQFTNLQTYQTQMRNLQQQMQKEQEAILTPAQKAKLKAIQAKYQTKARSIQQQAATTNTTLNSQMEALLTPAQKAKIKQAQGQRMPAMPGPAPK